jgi:lysophospholipase
MGFRVPDGYTPKKITCPAQHPSIRPANGLAPQESEWLQKRRVKQAKPMREFLKRVNIDGFDSDKYMDKVAQATFKDMPNIALAFSGGGYRALLNGAGAMAAFDSRTPGSLDKGGLGGILQSSTYVSGLSGGGWLVGSVFVNNFTSVDALVNQNLDTGPQPGLWAFDRSIVEGPKSKWLGGMFSVAEYWVDVVQTVLKKRSSLFEISVTDFWARALAHQMINTTEAGDCKSLLCLVGTRY